MKKYFWYILLVVLLLLGYATSIVKFVSLDAEIMLFKKVGFTEQQIFLFGLVQFIATILTTITMTRTSGAVILALTFLIATLVVFAAGMTGFGLFSISFILLALFFAKYPKFTT